MKAGNYKVAICYHQLDNQVNQSKLQATLDVFKELNIEAVCTTDAQSDANKEDERPGKCFISESGPSAQHAL